jgi:hypothetical protein
VPPSLREHICQDSTLTDRARSLEVLTNSLPEHIWQELRGEAGGCGRSPGPGRDLRQNATPADIRRANAVRERPEGMESAAIHAHGTVDRPDSGGRTDANGAYRSVALRNGGDGVGDAAVPGGQ